MIETDLNEIKSNNILYAHQDFVFQLKVGHECLDCTVDSECLYCTLKIPLLVVEGTLRSLDFVRKHEENGNVQSNINQYIHESSRSREMKSTAF